MSFQSKNLSFMPINEHVKFRPKARLLSILGEQLISNEIIAIKELVLNAFDADAEYVNINFTRNKEGKISEIHIIDNGCGMTESKIIDGWFTPATSMKTKDKKKGKTEKHKRPIMGEKGVGRFACRRLGESLEVYTKAKDFNKELFFSLEWSQYDVADEDIYLDQIENTIYSRYLTNYISDSGFDNYESGTRLIIMDLKDKWDANQISKVRTELLKLIPPYEGLKDFSIYIDGQELKSEIFLDKALYFMEGIIDDKGVLRYIIGTYPRDNGLKPGEFIKLVDFSKNIDNQLKSLNITYEVDNLLDSGRSPMGWDKYIERFWQKKIDRSYNPMCGNFSFTAYAWDLDAVHKKRVGINDKSSTEMLKSYCGISIYRDGFRVWPYGASGNDWLDLNKRAQGGQKPLHIANHQVIGYISLTQENNPYFIDKTNREGFIENDLYFEDFRKLILLSFKHLEDLRHACNQKERPAKDKEWWQVDKVLSELRIIKEEAKTCAPIIVEKLESLEKVYLERKQQTEEKIVNLLEVSSTGLVYESVTHELISFLSKIDDQSKSIEDHLNTIPPDISSAIESNILLNEALKIVLYEVKELQPYFKAARYQLKEYSIRDICEKAMKYYKYKLLKNKVQYNIVELSPMKRKVVEGFILQILINLLDNSIYWLDYHANDNKQILITIDGDNNCLYFSDNGKGVGEEAPYIFDPFYTKKDGGRGLGLYVVQELLANYKGSIMLDDSHKPESCTDVRKGTTFKILIL